MPRTLTQSLPIVPRTSLVRRLAEALTGAVERRHDRTLLARLDDHLLRDIGLSPDDARTECAKPFWRA